MKILVLYRNNRGNYNYFCNADFYKYLKEIPMVDIKFYGVQVDQLYPSLCLTRFDNNLTMSDLYEKYQFDVVILAGKNRTYYASDESKSWLPVDFDNYDCLKVLIEPDYHKYRKDRWFINRGIDIILHRHKSNVLRGIEDYPELKHQWFPFSVDTRLFHPTSEEKINKVCFVGNSKADAYYFRQNAGEVLKEEELLEFQGQVYEQDYIKILKKYSVYLNGSSIYTIDCAKAFEILSSGGILFTNDVENGFHDLFGNCFVTYKNDFSDVIKKANKILGNIPLQNKLIEKGLKVVRKKHTHAKRCRALVHILKRELKNKPIILKQENTPLFVVKPLNTNPIDDSNDISAKEKLKTIIYLLKNNEIDSCLLRQTCYERVVGSKLTYPIYLGVTNIVKAKELVSSKDVIFESIPKATKIVKLDSLQIKVPNPVISYLFNLKYDIK